MYCQFSAWTNRNFGVSQHYKPCWFINACSRGYASLAYAPCCQHSPHHHCVIRSLIPFWIWQCNWRCSCVQQFSGLGKKASSRKSTEDMHMWKTMQPLPWKTATDQEVNHVGSEQKTCSARRQYAERHSHSEAPWRNKSRACSMALTPTIAW